MIKVFAALAVSLVMLAPGFSPAPVQAAGDSFSGELNICAKVENAVSRGSSVEEAILNLFVFYSDQPLEIVHAIYEAIVFNSIRSCHLDGADVVAAALRFDLRLSLLVSGMLKAGLADSTIKAALADAGINSLSVQRAVSQASFSGGGTPVDYTQIIPPAYEVSPGLGPASAFVP